MYLPPSSRNFQFDGTNKEIKKYIYTLTHNSVMKGLFLTFTAVHESPPSSESCTDIYVYLKSH